MDGVFWYHNPVPRAQTMIGQRIGIALACIWVPMYQVIRQMRANQNRPSERIRRLAVTRKRRVPTPPPREQVTSIIVESQPIVVEPFHPKSSNPSLVHDIERDIESRGYATKRKAAEPTILPDVRSSSYPPVNSMNASKRRKLNFQPPLAWQQAEWHQQHVKGLSAQAEALASALATHAPATKYPLPTPSPTPSPGFSRRPQIKVKSRNYSSPYNSRYKVSKHKKTPRFNLTRDHRLPLDFLWSESDSESYHSPEPEDRDVTMHDATPVANLPTEQFNMQKATDPLPLDDFVHPEVEESLFDDDENAAFRAYLRAMPESFNDDGYKVPIFGTISPDTKNWNAEHRANLLRQAAHDHHSPSKVPQPPVTTPPVTPPRTPRVQPPKEPVPPSEPQQETKQEPESETQLQPENKTSFMSNVLSRFKSPIAWLSPRRSQTSVQSEEPAVPNLQIANQQVTLEDGALVKEDTQSTTLEESPDDQMEITPDENTPRPASSEQIDSENANGNPNTRRESGRNHSTTAPTTQAESEPTAASTQRDVQQDDPDSKAHHDTTATKLDPQTPAFKVPPKPDRDPYKTPAAQLAKLSLGTKTSKSKAWSEAKTERITRHQHKLLALEASKDKYKLVPLGDEWTARVRAAVRTGVKVDGFDKYTATDLSRVVPEFSSISGHDNWLNDVVINEYLSLVVKHGNKDDRKTQVPSHAAFTSHAWTKIGADPTSLPTKWAKKQGIQGKNMLECEQIFFPINSGMHWTLCVAEPKNHRRVTVYNSMGTYRGQFVAEQILAYIKNEVGTTFNDEEWSINPAGLSPQQQNSDDCGVFTITTARQIMLGQMDKSPYDASIMPTQRKRIVAELLNGGLLSAEESKNGTKP